MNIAVIGAGAAGTFAAVNLKSFLPEARVTIFETGSRPLAKLAITGGGRCNLTNTFAQVRGLDSVYPRGHRLMKRLFHVFNHEDTCKWFEDRGVRLVVQEDQCIFPKSQDAMEIVNLLEGLARRSGIQILTRSRVVGLEPGWKVRFTDSTGIVEEKRFDVVIAAGGGPVKGKGLEIFDGLDLEIVEPVPSLFTFSINDEALRSMTGTVVEDVKVGLSGTKFNASGPLLITDWGLSGPAVLKLSSLAARYLKESGYSACIAINWLGSENSSELLRQICSANPNKFVVNAGPTRFNSKLWRFLVSRAGISLNARWTDLNSKSFNRLEERLRNDNYQIAGRGKFKSEFVTAGGVALSNLNQSTMECKTHPGLFVIGEMADIDAITGGFNLQAAWTTAYVAAKAIADKYHSK